MAVRMTYDDENIFARILRDEIPADKVYEDEHVLAFRDAQPVAPFHVLVIPKQPVDCLANAADGEMLGRLLAAARAVAAEAGVATDGYRVVINNGRRANQSVFHLHVHVLAGRDFNWPPG